MSVTIISNITTSGTVKTTWLFLTGKVPVYTFCLKAKQRSFCMQEYIHFDSPSEVISTFSLSYCSPARKWIHNPLFEKVDWSDLSDQPFHYNDYVIFSDQCGIIYIKTIFFKEFYFQSICFHFNFVLCIFITISISKYWHIPT